MNYARDIPDASDIMNQYPFIDLGGFVMQFRKVREGSTELTVPVADIPEHARKYGFYNPEMETDRDISVAALSVFIEMLRRRSSDAAFEPEVCDLLCATGARGIRYRNEVGGIVTMCDANENAIELAGKNAQANGVEAEIMSMDANLLLGERKFDVIDIDPFGSPYPFIDSAARSISDFGLVCATATDTAALFGVYPEVSERRYGTPSMKCDFDKELGTRILAGFIMREFAKYNICFTPMLCYSRRHYVRIIGTAQRSAEKTEALIKKFSFLTAWKSRWDTGCREESGGSALGKVYTGMLHDDDFCEEVLRELEKRKLHGGKIVSTMLSESSCLFYYEADRLAKSLGIRMKMGDIIFSLQKSGFLASRTVFSDTGIKTNASWEEMEGVFGHGPA